MNKTVGDRIKARREDLGWTQMDLAKRVGASNKAAVSIVEHSGNDIGLNRINKYADALGVTPAYLMGWTTVTRTKQETELIEKFNAMNEQQQARLLAYADFLIGEF